jgi:hypothetical protein
MWLVGRGTAYYTIMFVKLDIKTVYCPGKRGVSERRLLYSLTEQMEVNVDLKVKLSEHGRTDRCPDVPR